MLKINKTLQSVKYAAPGLYPYRQHPLTLTLPSAKQPNFPAQQKKRLLRQQLRSTIAHTFAMSPVPVRRMDAGHVLMSNGWVVRGTVSALHLPAHFSLHVHTTV